LEFAQLLQVLSNHNVQDLKPEHLQRYLLHCIKNGLTQIAANQTQNEQ